MAAGVACAPSGSRFEQDCRQCHDPELRKRWGCDEPAETPVTSIRCPFCSGLQEDCGHCHGTNEIPIHRCPNKLVTDRELECVNACFRTEQGVLPDPGGWQDQAATFVAAWPLVMREIGHWREVAQQKAVADAKRKR